MKSNIDIYNSFIQYLDKEEVKRKEQGVEKQADTISELKHIKLDLKKDAPVTAKTVDSSFSIKEFEDLLRNELIKKYRQKQSYKRPYLSVTELVGCIKRIYFERQKYQINLNDAFRFPYLHLICEVGICVHSVVEKLYKFGEVEKKIVSEKYKVKGVIDAIRDNTIYEFKTCDKDKFTGSCQRGHYWQGLIYSWILNNEYKDYKIDNICIVYIFRDLRTVKVFDLKTNEEASLKLLNRSAVLHNCLNENKIPDVDIEEMKKLGECDFCSYKGYCKGERSVGREDNTIDNVVFLL